MGVRYCHNLLSCKLLKKKTKRSEEVELLKAVRLLYHTWYLLDGNGLYHMFILYWEFRCVSLCKKFEKFQAVCML